MLEGPPRIGDLAGTTPDRGQAWSEYDVPELIDHLVGTHHAYLVRELPRLAELARRVLAVERDPRGRLAGVLDALDQLDHQLGPHLLTEEEVLFPWCRRLHAGEAVGDWVAARMRCVHRDHTDTGTVLDRLRLLTDDFTVAAGASADHRALIHGLSGLDADIRLHVHKEEEVLFPALRAMAGIPSA